MYTLMSPAGRRAHKIEPSKRGVKICDKGRPAGAAKRCRVGTQSAVPIKVWGRVNFQSTRRVCRARVRREEEEEEGEVAEGEVVAFRVVEDLEEEEGREEEEEATARIATSAVGRFLGC